MFGMANMVKKVHTTTSPLHVISFYFRTHFEIRGQNRTRDIHVNEPIPVETKDQESRTEQNTPKLSIPPRPAQYAISLYLIALSQIEVEKRTHSCAQKWIITNPTQEEKVISGSRAE